MAIDSPYATAAEYKARVGKTGSDEDAEIDAQLEAVSRLVERELGESRDRPRIFNQSTATRRLDGSGEAVLFVDDLVTVTTIEVDTSLDASWATSFDLSENWVLARPLDYSEKGLPITAIELLAAGNSTLATWPDAPGCVRITGVWGWPAVPPAITEAVVMITRHLRDLEESGFTLTLSNLDAGVQMSPGAQAIVRELKSNYSRRIPSIGRW